MGRDSNERGAREYISSGNSFRGEIAKLTKQLDLLANGLTKEVARNKVLKRRAAKALEAALYLNAPRAKKEVKRFGKTIPPGGLRRSIKFLSLRRSNDVFVGSDFRVAPHAHLVEFGFQHANGTFVNGSHFAKRSYDQTAHLVLAELTRLAQKEFEKIGKTLEVG